MKLRDVKKYFSREKKKKQNLKYIVDDAKSESWIDPESWKMGWLS